MTPQRKTTIGIYKIEEYYWNGKMVVYVNNKLTEKTYEEVIQYIEDLSTCKRCSACGYQTECKVGEDNGSED
jgi:hypothetical protein